MIYCFLIENCLLFFFFFFFIYCIVSFEFIVTVIFYFVLSLRPFQPERLASGTSDIPDRRHSHVQNPQRWEETLAIKLISEVWQSYTIVHTFFLKSLGLTSNNFVAFSVDSVLKAGALITRLHHKIEFKRGKFWSGKYKIPCLSCHFLRILCPPFTFWSLSFMHFYMLRVQDPWHFVTDQDPRIRISGLRIWSDSGSGSWYFVGDQNNN